MAQPIFDGAAAVRGTSFISKNQPSASQKALLPGVPDASVGEQKVRNYVATAPHGIREV